jgi:glycosyltransferase involved in cell wall biosynthesis
LKILHLIASTGTGGAERHVLDLCRSQQAFGLTVCVVLPAGKGLDNHLDRALDEAGIPRMNIRPGGRWNLFALWSLKQAIKIFRPDIIHAHMPKSIAMVGHAGTQVPCVGTAHNIVKQVRPFHYCRQVICVSDMVQHSLLALGYPRDTTHVIHNAIDTERFLSVDHSLARQRLRWEGYFVMLCVARLVPAKGQRYALEALAALSPLHPELRLTLAGTGADQMMLQSLAKHLGVAEQVLFLGNRDDVPDLLAAADLYLQPSIKEGFGIAFLEAMASRLPCIGTPTGAIPEMVTHGENGLMVKVADAHSLSDAIQSLISRPELRHQLANAARHTAQSRFSLNSQARDTLQVYQQALAD